MFGVLLLDFRSSKRDLGASQRGGRGSTDSHSLSSRIARSFRKLRRSLGGREHLLIRQHMDEPARDLGCEIEPASALIRTEALQFGGADATAQRCFVTKLENFSDAHCGFES